MLAIASRLRLGRGVVCAALLVAAALPAAAQRPGGRFHSSGRRPPRFHYSGSYPPYFYSEIANLGNLGNPGLPGFPGYGRGYNPGYPVYGPVNVFPYGGFPIYPPVERVYVERQVIVAPGGYEGYRGEQYPDRERPRDEGAPPQERAPEKKDDFYLTGPKAESLADALSDIRRAWLNGDFSRLKDRFVATAQVRVFPKGKFAYALSGADFSRMTRDALGAIRTTAFDFDPVAQPGAERAFVTGRHAFAGPQPDGSEAAHTVHISYQLELRDGFWRIVEAGSSPDPIRRHEE